MYQLVHLFFVSTKLGQAFVWSHTHEASVQVWILKVHSALEQQIVSLKCKESLFLLCFVMSKPSSSHEFQNSATFLRIYRQIVSNIHLKL